MKVKVKVIMSYLMIAALIVIMSLGFIFASNKVNDLVNSKFSEILKKKEIVIKLNSEFTKAVITIKSLISAKTQEEVNKLKSDFSSNTSTINSIVNTKMPAYVSKKEIEKYNSLAQELESEGNSLISMKVEELDHQSSTETIFEELDLVYRQNKGYITVAKNAMSDQNYKNEKLFLDHAFEDVLEIKLYTNMVIGSNNEDDIEDSYLSIQSYTNALIAKVNSLIDGKSYHGKELKQVNNSLARKRLIELVKKNEDAAAKVDSIYDHSLKLFQTKQKLIDEIKSVEDTVFRTTEVFNALLVAAEKESMEVFRSVESLSGNVQLFTIIAVVVALVLSLAIGLFTSKRISDPLAKIISVAENIRNGHLNIPDIEHNSGDEFQTLTETINNMKHSLKSLVDNVTQISKYLGTNSQQSFDLMQDMYSQLNTTNAELANTASSTEELSVTTNEIVENVHVGITEVQNAKHMIIDGNDKLQNSITRVNGIAKNLSGVADNLDELNKASSEISNVIGIIVDIAEQTNLLALNAAIEAARAGEAGRGFAVVADEVRKLAEKTSTSTQEISSMVGKIQGNIGQVVHIVQQGIVDVEQGSNEITSVGESFGAVVFQMETATNSVEPIISIMHQQNEAIGSISSTVNMLSCNAEESTSIVEQVNNMAGELEKLSHNLQNVISKYNV